jgi:hypothetical protein
MSEIPRVILKPALVPRPLFNRSVCHVLGAKRKAWRSIRQQVIDSVASTCEYCGAKYDKGMVCHEVWNYDDHEHTATLIAFALTCSDCNFSLHAGLALEVGSIEGSISARGEQVVAHVAKVNGISNAEARRIVMLAFKEHAERSRHSWEIGIAADMVEKYPALAHLKL